MKSLKILFPVFGLSIVGFVHFFYSAGVVGSRAQGITPVARSTPRPIFRGQAEVMPDEMMYRVLFEQIAALTARDASTGRVKTDFKVSFYEERLELKERHFAALDFAAKKYLETVRPLDRRAAEIVRDYRAGYENGELKSAAPKPPGKFIGLDFYFQKSFEDLPPPAEILELQKRRDSIVLTLKAVIKRTIGDADFESLDAAVRKNAAEVISPEVRHERVAPPDSAKERRDAR